jgi:hypothetical protein
MGNLAAKQKLMSEAEYLAFEGKSKIKHEFMDGEIFSPKKAECEVSEDVKVRCVLY